jgi:hypothetical protein
MYVESVPNPGSPPAILLRESYRADGKVRKRTLLNLSGSSTADSGYVSWNQGVRRRSPGVGTTAAAFLALWRAGGCAHRTSGGKASVCRTVRHRRGGVAPGELSCSASVSINRCRSCTMSAHSRMYPAAASRSSRSLRNTGARKEQNMGPRIVWSSLRTIGGWRDIAVRKDIAALDNPRPSNPPSH